MAKTELSTICREFMEWTINNAASGEASTIADAVDEIEVQREELDGPDPQWASEDLDEVEGELADLTLVHEGDLLKDLLKSAE